MAKLFLWTITFELQSGRIVKMCGVTGTSRAATLIARNKLADTWSLEPEGISVVGIKRGPEVEFGV